MKIGNTITLLAPENPEQTKFVINKTQVFVECIRTLAHRVKNKQRSYVVLTIVSEEEFENPTTYKNADGDNCSMIKLTIGEKNES